MEKCPIGKEDQGDYDPGRIAQELEKLPARQPRGSPSNFLRAIAAGFVFMGYSAEESLTKARAVIQFYDGLMGGKNATD